MKLSEAMRLGALIKPQGFGALRSTVMVHPPVKWLGFVVFDSQYAVRTCALGAALDAIGALPKNDDADDYTELGFPILDSVASGCPVYWCDWDDYQAPCCVEDVIPHLNDEHKWTREQIAEWVECVECQHESAAVALPEEELAVK